MSAGIFDITIEQNATFEQDIYWNTASKPPVPVNLTNYTGKMQIRSSVTSTTPLYTLLSTTGASSFTSTTATGGIIIGTTDGHIELFLPDSITNGFVWTTGVYDLDLTAPSGFTTRLLQGKVTVSPAVTTI